MTATTSYLVRSEPSRNQFASAQNDADRSSIDREPSPLYKVGLAMFFISFGFDFKDRGVIDYSNTIRTIIVIVSLIGFSIAYSMVERNINAYRLVQKLNFTMTLWATYLIYLILITIVRSPLSFDVIRGGAPHAFMLLAMIIVKRHLEAGYKSDTIWKHIFYMSLISIVWNFYYGRYTSRTFSEDDFLSFMDDVRYSILSSAILPMFAIALYDLARFKRVMLSILLLAALMFLFLISKTRIYLIGIVCVAIYSMLTSPNRNKSVLFIIATVVVTFIGAVIVPLLFRNLDIIGIWAFRLGVANDQFIDITWYTRLAEYVGQFNLLLSDIQSAIFGYGYLKETYWDPYIFDLLVAYGNTDDYYNTYVPGGHSTWITSLFQGGLLIGSIPLISMTYLFIAAFLIMFKDRQYRRDLDHWGGIALGIIVAMWVPSNFASFFGDRILPMIIGASIIQASYELNRMKYLRQQ